jgi:hypothetical protein
MNEAKLVLHCGGQLATREQVAAVVTPDATDTWQPVPHIALIDQVESALTNYKMRVVTSAFALAKSGVRFFGLMQVALQDRVEEDYGYVVSLRNAHDKEWRILLGVGSTAFVCDNLAFSTEIQVLRKHTSRVILDLPNLVSRATGQLAESWNSQGERISAYKNHELTDSQANDLIVRAYEGGVAPITVLPEVIKEWRTPRHPEFAEHKNAWRLFNAFTEALKGNIWALPKRSQALHALMDTQVGILGRATAIDVQATVTA